MYGGNRHGHEGPVALQGSRVTVGLLTSGPAKYGNFGAENHQKINIFAPVTVPRPLVASLAPVTVPIRLPPYT